MIFCNHGFNLTEKTGKILMKWLFFGFVGLCAFQVVAAPEDDFLFTIQTRADFNQTFEILAHPNVSSYNYNIDCNNDGTDESTGVNGTYICDYTSLPVGTLRTIRIKDNTGDGTGYTGISFASGNSSSDFNNSRQIVELNQWGTHKWTTMERAFMFAELMVVTATDVPDLSAVTDTSRMFFAAKLANPDTSLWNVSLVQDMTRMFYLTFEAEPDTSLWDVSSVITFESMFLSARKANPDTSDWNVSSAENFEEMFAQTTVADPDTSDWELFSAINMSSMFRSAMVANPDTTDWETATVVLMDRMFERARKANPDTSNWDVTSVENFQDMFANTFVADPDTSQWEITSATNITRMFKDTINADPDVSGWDVSSILNFSEMFAGAQKANPDVSRWETSSLRSMTSMFADARAAKPDMSGWDISEVTDARNVLKGIKLSIEAYDDLLISWSEQTVQPAVEFEGGDSKYCNGENARMLLMANSAWMISDGGFSCDFGLIFENGFE